MRPGWVLTAAARQAEADRRAREMEFLNSPMYLWDKVLGGGKLAEEMAKPFLPQEAIMNPLNTLRDATLDHSRRGELLANAVRRWRPDPRKPGHSIDGNDLDSHPPEHRERKLKEAKAALDAHDSEGARVLNPLIAAAEQEPRRKLQIGTRLGASDTGEVSLLVQQYRDLTRQQQAELNTLGLSALDRSDLTAALQFKRAAEVLHVGTPELDGTLAEKDPVRVEGRGELDKLRRIVEASQADAARRHVRAGVADSVEQVGHVSWAQEHGFDPEASGSYVEATLSAGE